MAIQKPEDKQNDLDFLLQRVNIARAKAGKTAPKPILYSMLKEIECKQYYGYRRSWEILVELIADRLGIIAEPWKYAYHGGKVTYETMLKKGWIKQTHTQYPELAKHFEHTGMMEEYLAAAERDPWDHLGDIWDEQFLAGRANRLGQMLTPKGVVDMMIKMLAPDKFKKLELILEPAVGTGRFLIEWSLLYPEAPLVLFGVELDVTLYRACLVNMALYSKHPYSIVCANSLLLDVDRTGPMSEMWNRGNLWEPIDITDYYCKPPPIDAKHFSLSHFVDMNKKEQNTK